MEEMSMGNKDWIKPVIDEAIERLKARWSKLPADEDTRMSVWLKIAPQIITGQLSAPILMKDIV